MELLVRNEGQRDKFISNLSEIMDNARQMSDEEFELQKQELVSSLDFHDYHPRKELESDPRIGKHIKDMRNFKVINNFLLNPDLKNVFMKNWQKNRGDYGQERFLKA
ncbi:MAG: hypothetical protein ACLFQV_13310 [Vulcanimicrobiota bacterium]